jgi:tRNA threonylcarbamoyladenosine biosynthesis protein TsaB
MTLTIKTDNPEAEIGLFSKDDKKLAYTSWHADRQLSKDIHKKIKELLDEQKITWLDLTGIIFFEGPGSFTGLRIGAAVANSLSSELDIPIAQAGGSEWISSGAKKLVNDSKGRLAIPDYGRPARITKPRK